MLVALEAVATILFLIIPPRYQLLTRKILTALPAATVTPLNLLLLTLVIRQVIVAGVTLVAGAGVGVEVVLE